MAGGQEKWYFSKEQLQNSPSRKCGLDADKELAYRQQAANLIQDMGQRLQVSQLCINTAIVYMHRFYAFHSFTQFHRNAIAAAALFLAAKVEEQPRKLEYVIKVAHVCLHRGEGVNTLTSSEQYQEQAQDLVFNENVLLQTLGFDVAIDHPHTHVVRTCHLVKAPKDLAQTSYFMASNSLHLTTMCLQYKPTVVACFCIHLASKWSNWQIPQSHEGRHWFSYVDKTVTADLLERLTSEFLHIFDKCPSRLKKKMMTMSNTSGSSPNAPHPSNSASPFDRKKEHTLANSDEIDKSFDKEYERERRRQQVPSGYVPATSQPQKIDFNLYREKREREERERRQQAMRSNPPRPQPSQNHPSHSQNPQNHPNHSQNPQNHPNHSQSSQGHSQSAQSHSQGSQSHSQSSQSHPNHSQSSHHRPPHKTHPWPHKPPHHKPHDRRVPTQPPNPQPQLPLEMPRTRPPSLFSPENVTPAVTAAKRPPQPMPPKQRPPEKPSSPKKRPDPALAIREMQPPAILSPFPSPKKQSEPELIPVVKKLDEYENRKPKPEVKKPEVRNGIETDPTLVSNLLKESLAKPVPITEKKSPEKEHKSEEKHKKDKKKKEKHKHKDRDKNEKKKKKDKKKEPSPEPTVTAPKIPSPGLKIKIPKERLAIPPPPPNHPQTSGLKIKISRDVLENPRKRTNMEGGPPAKIPKDVKVGNWNFPPPIINKPQYPFYMVQQPPPFYYGMMDNYFYNQMYQSHNQMQHQNQMQFQNPPLPAMPPPSAPPPPPE